MPKQALNALKIIALPLLAVIALVLNPPVDGWATTGPTEEAVTPAPLEASSRHTQVSRMVTRFAERAHYTRTAIDDELSRSLLDNYIKSLDSNKHYFLSTDIEYFQRYRDSLDDTLRNNDMDPVFDIFRIYRLRAQQNLGYAISLLDEEPDFTIDEEYVFDREDLPWAKTEEETKDLWRQRIKNDAISLMLAEKSWEETAEVLEKRYTRLLKRINEIDSDDVIENFLNAFAHTLDPHSSYMSPRNSEEYRIQMSLSYQGIGASLQMEDDYVTIINIIPGGPAAIDGKLKANDRITAVGQGDGEMVDVIGWELDDVVQLIRGESGTVVRLQILGADMMPGDKENVLSLTRDKIKLEERAAQGEIKEIERDGVVSKIGVISVPSFYMDFEARARGDKDYVSTTRDVRRIIEEFQGEGITGLVMDLRGNGGGHLSEATALSGLFILEGPMVQLRDTSGRIEVLDDPEPAAIAYDGPLVVLVDRFSASASEIFAAAIQDYQRGLVVGQQTFGKGTVQNLYDLDQYTRGADNEGLGQLTLTIGKYYRVNGGSTQNRGVIPDIELPSAVDTKRIGESSRPGALPWDQIRSARYNEYGSLDAQISELQTAQEERVIGDPDYEFLLKSIDAATAMRNQTSVSLNIETRRQEQQQRRDDRLVRENERRTANGLETLEDNEALEESDRPDILLDQAVEIVTDYAGIAPAGESTVLSSSQLQ